jgi:hypothetical protein
MLVSRTPVMRILSREAEIFASFSATRLKIASEGSGVAGVSFSGP